MEMGLQSHSLALLSSPTMTEGQATGGIAKFNSPSAELRLLPKWMLLASPSSDAKHNPLNHLQLL